MFEIALKHFPQSLGFLIQPKLRGNEGYNHRKRERQTDRQTERE